MSGPKLEDGYTRIANELLEAITRTSFTKVEMKVLNVIIRKTFGYNKKKDVISLSQFEHATGTGKANISRAIKNLLDNNVIISNKNRFDRDYELNKHYTEWRGLGVGKTTTGVVKLPTPTVVKTTTEVLAKQQLGVGNLTIEGLSKQQPQKTKNKDSLKKGLKTKTYMTEKDENEIDITFEKFWDCYPKKVGRKKAFQKWVTLNPSKILLDEIIKAVETIKIFKWNHTAPKYIPDPATWIFQERWDDEIFDERNDPSFEKPRSVVERIQQANDLADERERLEFENSDGSIIDGEIV